MHTITAWAVRNSPAMNTLLIAVIAVGLYCVTQVRRESFPDFQLEIVLVTVPYPGASPAEIEEGICQKIEEQIQSLDGIKKVVGIARENLGTIFIEIEPGADAQRVLNEIRSRVDQISTFPEQAEDARVEQITLRLPAIRVAVIGPETDDPHAELRLRDITEEIREELLDIRSVTQVKILATKDYQIDVEIPEATLRAHNLTLEQVAQIVRRENLDMPAGTIRTEGTEYLVRGQNKRLTGEELRELPVVATSEGTVLTLGDLGNVRDAFTDDPASSEVNGRPGLCMVIEKTRKEDLLRICEDVQRYVARKVMPPGYELLVWGDTSEMVRDRLQVLGRNGLQGLLLVFLLLAFFLEFRLAFWVSLGIPFSVFGTLIVMYFFDSTLNMVSMFAFIMALGILVDDAIVVGENIYTHRQKGKDFATAAIDGTVEVAPSVCSSVTTTIIAFLPMFFVSGVMGKFIALMPMVVVAALAISLFEAVTVLPTHLANAKPSSNNWMDRFSDWTDRGMHRFIENYYRPAVQWCLRNNWTVLAIGFSLLLWSIGLIASGKLPFVTMPKLDSPVIRADISFPSGTPAALTDDSTRRIEQAAIDLAREIEAKEGRDILLITYRSIGEVEGDAGMQLSLGGNVGQVTVELVDSGNRDITSDEFIRLWRERAGTFPGVDRIKYDSAEMGPGGKPIEFRLLSKNDQDLNQAVELAKRRLLSYPGVQDVSDDSQPGKWELQVRIKPEAEALGITNADLAQTIRSSYFGSEAMRLQRGRHEIKLMVRYPPEERRSLANFEEIRIRTPAGDEVPLTELADVSVTRGYSEIKRINQRQTITVSADVEPGRANAAEVSADLTASFLPELFRQFPGMTVRWEGQQQQNAESMQSLFIGFVVAFLSMYVLLTMQFKSYFQPLFILVSVPFGLVGAVLGHLVMGIELTMFSLFGMVALAGIVVNDSIVFIDFVNMRRAEGYSVRRALEEAGTQRFRPILLTSITTIGGLTPIMFEQSLQAQVLIPMAVTICFGMLLTTFIVLLQLPAIYLSYAQLTGADIDEPPPVAEAAT